MPESEASIRVIHGCPNFEIGSGGVPVSVVGLAKALTRTACSVEILRAKKKQRAHQISIPAGVRERELQSFFHGTFTLGFLDEGYSADNVVFHSHGLWSPFNHRFCGIAAKVHRPTVISPRGMLTTSAMRFSRWKKLPAWWLYQRADLKRAAAFHATSAVEAEDIRRFGFTQPVGVISDGIELNTGLVETTQTKQATVKTALFLSRLHPIKNLPMLVTAWSLLNPSNWRLLIAGNDEGGHRAEVEQLVCAYNLQDRVKFIGQLSGVDKARAYQEADLFVLPSRSENFGIVVAEALMNGTPVIATTASPWEDLIKHQCGWWVPPTIEGIQAGLAEAFSKSDTDLRTMGLNGRRLVERKYQWRRVADDMICFYQWLLKGGPKPTFVV